MKLKGKKILVTGGASGYGYGMAESLAAAGGKVWNPMHMHLRECTPDALRLSGLRTASPGQGRIGDYEPCSPDKAAGRIRDSDVTTNRVERTPDALCLSGLRHAAAQITPRFFSNSR